MAAKHGCINHGTSPSNLLCGGQSNILLHYNPIFTLCSILCQFEGTQWTKSVLYIMPRGGSVYSLAICLHSWTYWKSKWGDRMGWSRVLKALARAGTVNQLISLDVLYTWSQWIQSLTGKENTWVKHLTNAQSLKTNRKVQKSS